MSQTIQWNLRLTVRDGQLDAARALMAEMVAATKEESGTIGYEWYLSSDEKVCHIIERYADSAAVLVHLGNFGSKFAKNFMQCFEATGFAVYGDPSAEAKAGLDILGAKYMGWLGGFTR